MASPNPTASGEAAVSAATSVCSAGNEAATIDGLVPKITALRVVAATWLKLEPTRAKTSYQRILQAAEKADLTTPEVPIR